MKFNEKLIELRKQKGLSQEELGYKLNVTRQTVSKWELGQTTPEMDKLVEMSKVFSISVDELINESEMQTNTNPIEDQQISNKTGKEKIVKIVIIVVFIIIVLSIIVRLILGSAIFDIFNKVTDEQDNILNQASNFISFIGETANNMSDTLSETTNNISQSSEEINKRIDETRETIDEGIESMDITSFNGPIEVYSGTTGGNGVSNLLNQVVKINTTEDMKITVKYNDIETQDVEEIGNIQSEIEAFKMYKISLGYNTDGYINKVTIQKTNE